MRKDCCFLMTVVSKVVLPAAVLASGAFATGSHPLPHPPTVSAHIDELEREEVPVRAYQTDPVVRDWLNRFGHISSLRLLARMARAIETTIRPLWDGKSSPPGSKPANERSRNTFGQGR